MTAAAQAAGGVTLPVRVVTPPANPDIEYERWAHEVGEILTAALARDDERNRLRCPRCGQIRFDENLS